LSLCNDEGAAYNKQIVKALLEAVRTPDSVNLKSNKKIHHDELLKYHDSHVSASDECIVKIARA
jgi:hypothetical protein